MGDTNKVVVDTNLLVRYLRLDDPEKAKAVELLFDRASKGEIYILLPAIVIAELVWVLESFYKMKAAEIYELIEAILNTPGFEVQEREILLSTIKTYNERGIDLVDAWIIEFAKEKGISTIYSFDKKHFRNIDGISLKQP